MDDEIISAVSGNAFGGETGSTTVALPSGQKITEINWWINNCKTKKLQKKS